MCSLIDAYLENVIEPIGSASEAGALRIGVSEVVGLAPPTMAASIALVAHAIGLAGGALGTGCSPALLVPDRKFG